MYDRESIRSAVAHDPLRFLAKLYGDTVRDEGENAWRVGTHGGKKFDTQRGELLCCDFTSDAESGDCFSVWQAHCDCDFLEALAAIASLYSIPTTSNAGSKPPQHKTTPRPRTDPGARLALRPSPWPNLDPRHAAFTHEGHQRLATAHEWQDSLSTWRGWPAFTLIRLARASIIGAGDFTLWPNLIRPQPGAFFPIHHPVPVVVEGKVTHWQRRLVGIHFRFRHTCAATLDARRLTWLCAPSKKQTQMTDGANAPLIISRNQEDPEQPVLGTRCECLIITAGEWDAVTVLLSYPRWTDDLGGVHLPPGLAIVGIRGEGRGGTDSFLRHYAHWRPRSIILLADRDKTGATWCKATDTRPCFAQQLELRGARVLPRMPRDCKDINDLYREGKFGPGEIEALLLDAAFTPKGDNQ